MPQYLETEFFEDIMWDVLKFDLSSQLSVLGSWLILTVHLSAFVLSLFFIELKEIGMKLELKKKGKSGEVKIYLKAHVFDPSRLFLSFHPFRLISLVGSETACFGVVARCMRMQGASMRASSGRIIAMQESGFWVSNQDCLYSRTIRKVFLRHNNNNNMLMNLEFDLVLLTHH